MNRFHPRPYAFETRTANESSPSGSNRLASATSTFSPLLGLRSVERLSKSILQQESGLGITDDRNRPEDIIKRTRDIWSTERRLMLPVE